MNEKRKISMWCLDGEGPDSYGEMTKEEKEGIKDLIEYLNK